MLPKALPRASISAFYAPHELRIAPFLSHPAIYGQRALVKKCKIARKYVLNDQSRLFYTAVTVSL